MTCFVDGGATQGNKSLWEASSAPWSPLVDKHQLHDGITSGKVVVTTWARHKGQIYAMLCNPMLQCLINKSRNKPLFFEGLYIEKLEMIWENITLCVWSR